MMGKPFGVVIGGYMMLVGKNRSVGARVRKIGPVKQIFDERNEQR